MARTATFWNMIARRYARSPVPDAAVYRRKLDLTRAAFPPRAEVLEIGCGTGTTAVAHAPHVAHLRAVDVSGKMLEIARARAKEAGAENITFEEAEIADIVMPPASYDAVLALSILHLLPDWGATVGRIADTLRPGGVFVSSTTCPGRSLAWLGLLKPVTVPFGLLPDVQFLTMDDVRGPVTGAGLVIEEDWVPNDGRVLFLIARKPAA